MTLKEIMAELESMANPSIKKVMQVHGAREPHYGVKIEDLKKIQKRVKKDYKLALELYDTGNFDAMYLAGLIADDAKMTKKDLQKWADGAYSGMHGEYTVPWVAAGSPHGWELALKWIDSKKPTIAASGWATISSLVSITPDDDLDLEKLRMLLGRVESSISDQPNRVKYSMTRFVIALGIYVKPLHTAAMATAKRVGKVEVDVGDSSCKTPFAPEYIQKAIDRGSLGKKRKTAKC